MVQDDGPVGLDGVRVVFDDRRAVSDAGSCWRTFSFPTPRCSEAWAAGPRN